MHFVGGNVVHDKKINISSATVWKSIIVINIDSILLNSIKMKICLYNHLNICQWNRSGKGQPIIPSIRKKLSVDFQSVNETWIRFLSLQFENSAHNGYIFIFHIQLKMNSNYFPRIMVPHHVNCRIQSNAKHQKRIGYRAAWFYSLVKLKWSWMSWKSVIIMSHLVKI